jgi:CheY-like chemotaxis protein
MPFTLVLSVGLDSLVLATRNLFLQSEGYIVVSALSVKEAVGSFRNGDFDLVLLDNSLPTKDRDRLTCLIRASGSRVPVASVAPEHSHDDSFADAMLESDPNKLLLGMRSVLLKTARMSDYVSLIESKDRRRRILTDGRSLPRSCRPVDDQMESVGVLQKTPG